MSFDPVTFNIFRLLAKYFAEKGVPLKDGTRLAVPPAEARQAETSFDLLTEAIGPQLNWSSRRNARAAVKTVLETDLATITTPDIKYFVHCGAEYVADEVVNVPRYIYVPWRRDEVEELANWAEKWKQFTTGRGKEVQVIFYGTKQEPLKGVNPISPLYILGHGSAGSSTISKQAEPKMTGYTGQTREDLRKHLVAEMAPLDFTILAYRLTEDKLPKEFAGSIKIYACSAGSPGIEEGTASISFTKQFSQLMRARGYSACEYIGYKEDLAAPSTFEMVGHRGVAASSTTLALLKKMALLQAQLDLRENPNLTPEAAAMKAAAWINAEAEKLLRGTKKASTVKEQF